MTMKSTLIVLIVLAAALATGIVVHNRLGGTSFIQDAAPTLTESVATAEPVVPPPMSLSPASAPQLASRPASLVDDAAPTQTASIRTPDPIGSSPVSLQPFAAAPTGTPGIEPPPRMTASQEAGLNAWMIKTYLGCWKQKAQPDNANRYVAQVRLNFKPDGSLLKPPKLVNPPSDPAQKPQAKSVLRAVEACNPLPVPAEYRSFYDQWKTKTVLFDPQVAAR
jgi:hypothetical protein